MKKTNLLIFFLLLLLTTNLFSQIFINEYSASNLSDYLDNYQKYEDWIELYNAGSTSVDLTAYYLSDNEEEPLKWQIPSGTILYPGNHIVFWCSGRDESNGNNYHTNFKLKQTKDVPEVICLSNSSQELIDSRTIEITQVGNSRGRTTDGAATWSIFDSPTKGSSNNSSIPYEAYAQTPSMNYEAGFYTNTLNIEIESAEPNVEIHYTTNGNKPTSSSPIFSSPITVNETTIINAKAFSSNPAILPSLTCFNTYFINEEHSLSVISTSADNLKTMLNGNASIFPVGTIEYFDENGVRTTYGFGNYNKHGQDSWANPHRSFDYIAKDEYGYNYALRHEIISKYTDRDEYQRLILRASGDDNYPGIDSSAMLRDMLVEDLATMTNMYLDCRKGEKGVVYVNGEFWGVYGFREKVSDADYTKYYHNQDKYNIQYLMLWGNTWAQYGGTQALNDWAAIRGFILNNDMSQLENYAYVLSQFDVRSLVDYIHINSYVVCTDWINWNVGWWRGLDPEGDHKKWGYILWDEDATFNHYINYTGVPDETPLAPPCYPEGISADPGHHIEILNKLLENPEFNNYYLTRYLDLMNIAFSTEVMIPLLDTIAGNMAPEMPQQIERWGGSMAEWEANVQKVHDFITEREAFMPTGFNDCWNLVGPYDINFEIEPTDVGNIQINSIRIKDYPKQMQYYGGVNSHLTAIPTELAYEFDYWELENNSVMPNIESSQVSINFIQGDNIIAHFKLKEYADSLVINEINYKSADDFDTGDWVELYNPMDNNLDISNWNFKDNNDNHSYLIPEGTIINAHDYLVLCQNSETFHSLFPEVENYLGNFDFGLSGGGELIRLFDASEALVDAVEYDDEDPWPTEADGNGPTLELVNPSLDNNLGQNWQASEAHGTPGEENSTVGISWIKSNQYTFSIYPNPMKDKAFLQILSNNIPNNSFISIINVFGQEVRRIENLSNKYHIIERKSLSPGVYFCNYIDNNNRILGKQKLVIK